MTYLKIPDREDENNYFEYIEEFMKYSNDKSVFCISAQKNYKKWLKDVNLLSKGSYKKIEPILLYFFMDDDKLIGHIAIKAKLNLNKEDIIAGNIDGAIRPTMRNRGYGKQMLSLALKECKKISLEEVIVNCSVNNPKSNKNIIDNGGILQKILYDPDNNQKYRQYKIRVKK